MKKILVIGAGRSSSSLIKYLLSNALKEAWEITVADISLELAREKISGSSHARAIAFDINNQDQRAEEIENAHLVISMLPATMHTEVARDCVRLKKHLVTASYVSPEMRALDEEAKKAGVILLNEMGLDPGIDHMSAMQVIERVKNEGGKITSFKSYCGGLIAPESDTNPWGYKFTWNPRNVVLAGQGVAHYMEDGRHKYLPYHSLFKYPDAIGIEDYGRFDGYANRDSLSYQKFYGLEEVSTMLRGTLRKHGFCEAWNAFVQLGWTDDSYKIAHSAEMTYEQLLDAYVPVKGGALGSRLAAFLELPETHEVMDKLRWLGIFSDKPVRLRNATPAQVLQSLLEEKWKLETDDIDMIVMQHQFDYIKKDKKYHLTSSLVVKGEDQTYTAMAKTVGLPAAIAAKLILNDSVKAVGVQIPVTGEIYEPALKELELYGIKFEEKEAEV